MNFLNFLLFAPQNPDGKSGGGGYQMLIMLGLIVLVFYFFMIRPQQKKQKQMTNFRDNLKRGDKIVTIGGIHGKITDVQEGTFIIEVEDGTKIRIEKAAVAVDPNASAKKD
ncbi:MAG: preprotein translocase subunit YajC [Bacteroidetes bacterium]|nr:preprotein translocase subunit YajC [Bacteroidota bacterium]MCL1969059.1 preprotein translocase subunit YajC [Bacteroidota bacterium]